MTTSEVSFGKLTRLHNQHARSMSELTPWLFGLTPDIVCNKDSGLMAVFELTGLDVDSAPNAQINDLSQKLEYALSGLVQASVPITLWFQARRLRSTAWPTGHFPDPISARLDALRKEDFDNYPQYSNRHYLCLLMQAPKGLNNIAAKLAALTKNTGDGQTAVSRLLLSIKDAITGDTTREFKYSAAELGEAINTFEKLLSGFESAVQHLSFRRLSGDELGGFLASTTDMTSSDELRRAITPSYRSAHQTAADADDGIGQGIPRFLDTRLPNATLQQLGDEGDGKTLSFQCGGIQRYARVTSVVDHPTGAESYPAQLDALLYVPGELVVTVVFQCLSKAEAMKIADNARRFHANRKFSMKQLLNSAMNKGETAHLRENTARSSAEADAALVHDNMSMGRDMIGYAYANVVSLGNSFAEALRVSEQVERTLNNARYPSILEGIHSVGAWSATLPGMYGNIVRWLPMSIANIADIAPVRTVNLGNKTCRWLTEQTNRPQPAACILPTDLGTPYWFDFFANGPGHGMLVGPAGAGKSVMGGFLCTMMRRYTGAQVIVMDKDLSLRIPVLLQGGSYSDLSPESKQPMTINPLLLLKQGKEHLPWVSTWVELLLSQDGSVMSTEDKTALQNALASLSLELETTSKSVRMAPAIKDPAELLTQIKAPPATGRRTRATQANAAGVPTLSRLFTLLPNSVVKDKLRQWVKTEDGVMSAYFDNVADAFELTSIQGFEMGSILQNPQLAVPFTEYLFYRIEQHLKTMRAAGHVAPMMIYLSEVWHLLKNPAYSAKIVDWLKTLRKFSAMVWMDTQSLEDLVQSDAFSALRDNVPNKIFLPNFEAQSAAAKRIYVREFQLTEEQVMRIVQGTPKRHYFLRQGSVARMLEMPFGKEELAILRSDNRAQAAIDAALRAKDDGEADWRDIYFDAIK